MKHPYHPHPRRCVILLVLIAACLAACADKPTFRRETARSGDFHQIVHVSGTLQSPSSLYIGCPAVEGMWQYTISFMATEGKTAVAGEMVLGFDTRQLMERLSLKQSELDALRKELEKIRLQEQDTSETLDLQLAEARVQSQKARQKIDVPPELVKAAELNKQKMDHALAESNEALAQSRIDNQRSGMKTRIRTQEAKVAQLEAGVRKLQEGMARLRVPAPRAGVIVYCRDWRERKKAVGDRCWMGDSVLEMPDLSRMQVKVAVPEAHAGRVQSGQKVEIRLDANPDRVFHGTVSALSRVFRSKSFDQPAVVFDAVIDILDPDPQAMRPGMAAAVDIVIASRRNVLQVPEAAVVYSDQGTYVWKKGFPTRKKTTVTLGAHSAGMVEIRAGLRQGDVVLIPSGEKGESQ